MKRTVILFWAAAWSAAALNAGSILLGGLGGHSNGDSTNDGALAIVNQTTGVVSIIGHPAGVSRIPGLAFDLNGVLLAATQPDGGFPPPPGPTGVSQLLTLWRRKPLYDQQGDGLGHAGGRYRRFLWSHCVRAEWGSLFMASADLDPVTDNLTNIGLKRLNPANAAQIGPLVPTADFLQALAVRPDDGVIFGGTGDSGQLFTVDAATGKETLIGSTGRNLIGDLAFQAIPEPSSLALVAIGCAALLLRKRVTRAGA